MADFIKTLIIEPQENAAELARAMAAALAKALNWTLDEDKQSVCKPDSLLRFFFYISSSYVGCVPLNKNSLNINSNGILWEANTSYCVDYVRTDHSVAVGCRNYTNAVGMDTIISENTLGEDVGFKLYSSSFQIIRSYNDKRIVSMVCLSDTTAGTSLVKYPDIYGGCMFSDLYLMMSCPNKSSDKVFYIGGRYFRFIGNSYGGFALPVS